MVYSYDRRKTAVSPWDSYDTWKTTPPDEYSIEQPDIDDLCHDVKIAREIEDVLKGKLKDLPKELVAWLTTKNVVKGVRVPALKVGVRAECSNDTAEWEWVKPDKEGYYEVPLRAVANLSLDLPHGLLEALERHTKGKSPNDLAADLIREFILSTGGWDGIPYKYELGPKNEMSPIEFDLHDDDLKVNVNRARCDATLTYSGVGRVTWSAPEYGPDPDGYDDQD